MEFYNNVHNTSYDYKMKPYGLANFNLDLDPTDHSKGLDNLYAGFQNPYWLNTRFENNYGYVWMVNTSGDVSYAYLQNGSLIKIRPIAIIDSNLKVKKVNNVWQIAE